MAKYRLRAVVFAVAVGAASPGCVGAGSVGGGTGADASDPARDASDFDSGMDASAEPGRDAASGGADAEVPDAGPSDAGVDAALPQADAAAGRDAQVQPADAGAPAARDAGSPRADAGTLPAFPGAEGFGAWTPGGRGGAVFEVTNLNDAGSGSLRACVEASGPRVCVFKVGGTILLETSLVIRNPFITIAGQTAPGGGITLRTGPNHLDPLVRIQGHDIVIRYLTARPQIRAATGPDEFDAMVISTDNGRVDSHHVVIDHCSMSWGTDQVFSSWYGPHDFTVQWSVFSEGLSYSTHSKGRHSKGPMFGSGSVNEAGTGPGAGDISFHHNLMANNEERNPLFSSSFVADVVNNVSYNPGETTGTGEYGHIDLASPLSVMQLNFVGNYFKPGPHLTSTRPGIRVYVYDGAGLELFVQGNIGTTRTDSSLPEADTVYSGSRGYLVSARHVAPPITTHSCDSYTSCEVYDVVLAGAGNNARLDADGVFRPRRDAVDRRVVEEVRRGEGRLIDAPGASTCKGVCRGAGFYLTPADYTKYGITEPLDADGWPVIAGGAGYADADHDGMSDEWETRFSFDPGLASDGNLDADGDGYTNLEEFLNGTNPRNP